MAPHVGRCAKSCWCRSDYNAVNVVFLFLLTAGRDRLTAPPGAVLQSARTPSKCPPAAGAWPEAGCALMFGNDWFQPSGLGEIYLPYVGHISDQAVLLRDGSVMAMGHVKGAWLSSLRKRSRVTRACRNLNTLFRNIAGRQRATICTHLIRHPDVPELPAGHASGSAFARWARAGLINARVLERKTLPERLLLFARSSRRAMPAR